MSKRESTPPGLFQNLFDKSWKQSNSQYPNAQIYGHSLFCLACCRHFIKKVAGLSYKSDVRKQKLSLNHKKIKTI